MTDKRTFDSGATRDTADGKPDYEGFISPLVIKAFGEYMNSHRTMADGSLRDSDNWQKGIPQDVYMKSMWRHFFDVWSLHRGYRTTDHTGKVLNKKDSLTALLFNVQGYLHELLVKEEDFRFGPKAYKLPEGYIPVVSEPGTAVKVANLNDIDVIDGVAYYKAKSKYEGDWNLASNPYESGFWRIDSNCEISYINVTGEANISGHSFSSAVRSIDSGQWVRNKFIPQG